MQKTFKPYLTLNDTDPSSMYRSNETSTNNLFIAILTVSTIIDSFPHRASEKHPFLFKFESSEKCSNLCVGAL